MYKGHEIKDAVELDGVLSQSEKVIYEALMTTLAHRKNVKKTVDKLVEITQDYERAYDMKLPRKASAKLHEAAHKLAKQRQTGAYATIHSFEEYIKALDAELDELDPNGERLI